MTIEKIWVSTAYTFKLCIAILYIKNRYEHTCTCRYKAATAASVVIVLYWMTSNTTSFKTPLCNYNYVCQAIRRLQDQLKGWDMVLIRSWLQCIIHELYIWQTKMWQVHLYFTHSLPLFLFLGSQLLWIPMVLNVNE